LSDEAIELQRLFADAPPGIAERLEAAAHDEALEIYQRARQIDAGNHMRVFWKNVEAWRERGVEATTEDVAAASRAARAASEKPGSEAYAQAVEKLDAEKEARQSAEATDDDTPTADGATDASPDAEPPTDGEPTPGEILSRAEESAAEVEAHSVYELAQALEEARRLSAARERIQGIRHSGGRVSRREEDAILDHARAESDAPTASAIESAGQQESQLLEAYESSPLSQDVAQELFGRRGQVIDHFQAEMQHRGVPVAEARVRAAMRLERILASGKFSGHNTHKGPDRTFGEYTKESARRIRGTWRDPYNRKLLGLRMIPVMGVRLGAEAVNGVAFVAGKALQRGLERRRFSKLLSEVR
jgi:hypothetical protein